MTTITNPTPEALAADAQRNEQGIQCRSCDFRGERLWDVAYHEKVEHTP